MNLEVLCVLEQSFININRWQLKQVNKQLNEVKDVNTETEWKIDTDNAVLEGSNPNSAHTQW